MTDFISREAAIKAAMKDTGFHRSHEFNAGCARAANNLKAIPTADVAPVRHGTWLPIVEANEDGSPYQTGVFCSECRHCDCVETNYCPNCGAKMGDADV